MAERHTEHDATSNMPHNGGPLVEDFDRLMRDLAKVMTEPDIGEWMTTATIGLLSVVRHHPQYWGRVKRRTRSGVATPTISKKRSIITAPLMTSMRS